MKKNFIGPQVDKILREIKKIDKQKVIKIVGEIKKRKPLAILIVLAVVMITFRLVGGIIDEIKFVRMKRGRILFLFFL